MFPVQNFRNDTPGCSDIIHFNNAGCSLHPAVVVNAVTQYLVEESKIGGYELAALRQAEIDDFYAAAAAMLNAQSNQIAFVNSATDGYTKALSAIDFKQGDIILTSIHDYVSSQIQFAALQQRFGVEVVYAQNTETGEVDVADIENLINKHRPKLVSITHVPNNTGMVQPVAEIGALCAEAGIWYIVDACQSAGQIPLDVQQIQCDFLTFSMRKFMRGPRGTGALYVSQRALDAGLMPMLPDMRGADWTGKGTFKLGQDAKRFEYIEQSYALVIGAAVAMRYYQQAGPQAISDYNQELSTYFRAQLQAIPHIHVLDKGSKQCNIISLVSDTSDIFTFRDTLIKNGINCGAAGKKFALLDFMQKEVEGAVRLSPHYYNTRAEVDRVIEVIRQNNI